MYTSGDGKEFKLFDSVKHCYKCDAATVVCPHRILASESLVLPQKTTHIRLLHPLLALRTSFDFASYERTCMELIESEKKAVAETEFENPNV
jgi:hypothetical protein